MRQTNDLIDLLGSGMKGQQWERAKGELRAMVMLVGGMTPHRAVGDTSIAQWQQLEIKIETFIKDVEDNGLHE